MTSDCENKNNVVLFNSDNASVQPSILLRTAIFTPKGRKNNEIRDIEITENDVTDELEVLEVFQKEGFDSVQLIGQKLDIDVDFKVWCGIVYALSLHGLNSNVINIPFTQFLKYCGYSAKLSDSKWRGTIGESLVKLQGQQLSFRQKGGKKGLATGLVHRAYYDIDKDVIELVADQTLWDLYEIERRILVNLQILKKLPRAEVAKALYLYILSLPKKPYPISFTRFRERLQLDSEVKRANEMIKRALLKLEDIGFLSGQLTRTKGEFYYIVDQKKNKLEKSIDNY